MTKKNKILTIFFSVKTISVSWESEKNVLSSTLDSDIIEKSNIKTGTNVFFVSKTNGQNNIEKNFPYIKILNIETKFPNKIIIHAIERNEVFAFQKDDKYYITDSDLKVLRVESGDYVSNKDNPIKILSYECEEAFSGDFLNAPKNFDAIKTLESSFCQNYEQENQAIALVDMLAMFSEITVFEDKMLIKYCDGVNIAIYAPTINQQKKIAMALYMLDNELSVDEKKTGTISVITKDGKIVGSYKQ